MFRVWGSGLRVGCRVWGLLSGLRFGVQGFNHFEGAWLSTCKGLVGGYPIISLDNLVPDAPMFA